MTTPTLPAPPLAAHRWSCAAYLEIDCEPELVGLARRFTRDTLTGVIDARTDDAILLVSELVTNAVNFAAEAGPPSSGFKQLIGLGVECGPRWLRLCVCDPYPDLPEPRQAAEDDESGRGLREIVEAYADAWWVDPRPSDKTIHAVLLHPGEVLLQEDINRFGRGPA